MADQIKAAKLLRDDIISALRNICEEGSEQDWAADAVSQMANELIDTYRLIERLVPYLRRPRDEGNAGAVAFALDADAAEARRWCLKLGIDPDGPGRRSRRRRR